PAARRLSTSPLSAPLREQQSGELGVCSDCRERHPHRWSEDSVPLMIRRIHSSPPPSPLRRLPKGRVERATAGSTVSLVPRTLLRRLPPAVPAAKESGPDRSVDLPLEPRPGSRPPCLSVQLARSL